MSATPNPRFLIDDLLDILVENRGSDLHLQLGQPPKIRKYGEIKRVRENPLTLPELETMFSQVLGPDLWRVFQEKGEVRIGYDFSGAVRFRCNFYRQVFGLEAVFRLIPTIIPSLQQLGIPEAVSRFAHEKSGLVLVTGHSGSGKTTLLAALFDYMNANLSRHILTIEEPIEFVHQNRLSVITQREVGKDTPSFASALEDCMHQDVDVVMVGVFRDLESILMALKLAESGKLVFATSTTRGALPTINRLIEVFHADRQPEVRAMVAANLRGIVTQVLMNRKDGEGQIPVHEILISNNAVSAIIRDGAVDKLDDVLESGKAVGMQFLDDAILRLLKMNLITLEEACKKALGKKGFMEFLE